MLTTRLGPEWVAVAPESDVAEPGTYTLAEANGVHAIVARGRDGVLRAFENACKHRGAQVLDEPCGKVTRLQCVYHSWVYDLEGNLVRAKHTDDLDDFDTAAYGLTPIPLAVVDAVVHLQPPTRPAPPARTEPLRPGEVLTADEVAAVRREYRAASLLPGRAYQDEAIFDYERTHWFRRDWVCLGRVEDTDSGPVETQLDGERIVLARGADGAVVAQRPAAPDAPVRVDTWHGFVFVALSDEPPALREFLGDLVDHVERFDFAALRAGHREVYDVRANWKLIAENYSECYHCPGVHPQLNRITPYDSGADYETSGAWQGGWMELREGFDTMALEGGHRVGPAMCGITPVDERRVDYLVVWPAMFVSVHPDYLLVHRLEPLAPDRTRIVCDWLFEPATMARPDFDPQHAIDFWHVTNQQDWHVCELQQIGTASPGFRAGRFADNEPSVHAFDLMCVDRYEGTEFVSQRTVRERYDVPPPK